MKLIRQINIIVSKYSTKFVGKGATADIFKNMGILAYGAGIAKVISLLTIPIITRIYTPEDFGVLAVFTTAIILIVPLSTMLYSITIPLPKNDGIATNIVAFCSFLIVVISIFLSLLFFLFGEIIFGFFNMVQIAAYWWLLIFGIFSASVYELMTHWATRVKAFPVVAKTEIWQASISAILKIGLGVAGFKPIGLLIGDVGQRGGGVFTLISSFINQFKKNIEYVTLSRIKFLVQYYGDLPLYRLPSQLLFKFSSKIPILYFAYQFGKEATGQLGLSFMVVGLPISLLGTSTGKAYYAEIAKLGMKNKSSILSITKNVIKRLAIISFIPTLVLVLFAPILFQIVFGNEWEQAGLFTSILAIYLLIQFITSPMVNVFTVFNRQRKFLEINIVRTILMGVVFGLSYIYILNAYQTLTFYVIIICIHYIYVGLQVYRIIK